MCPAGEGLHAIERELAADAEVVFTFNGEERGLVEKNNMLSANDG